MNIIDFLTGALYILYAIQFYLIWSWMRKQEKINKQVFELLNMMIGKK